jgi:hypothetical protein
LSHTVSGQVWQTGETEAAEGGDAGVNFETGQGIPAWAIKIDGRLLEVRLICICMTCICSDVINTASKSTSKGQSNTTEVFYFRQTDDS